MKRSKFLFLLVTIILLGAILRVYRFGQVPPAPYWEEVALGYDAFSILKTGKDHHGNPWPVVAFESFGDFKPALYFYTIIPFVWLFDLSVMAVRLPSLLAGLSLVFGVGYLARLLATKNKQSWQLWASFVTAISPWAIQFSRAGWEVNLATALILFGVICGIKSLLSEVKFSWRYLIASAVLLVLAMYSYHAARIIAPLLGLGIAIWWLFQKKSPLGLTISGALAILLLLPLIWALGKPSTTQRFAETSIFTDTDIILESNRRQEWANNDAISQIRYHRYVLYSKEVLINFFDHFHPTFLFISGDINPRHSTQFIGHFYYHEAILLLLGIYWLIKQKKPRYLFLAWWLIVGILPAAMSKTTPHALRILPTLPVWILVITAGIDYLKQTFKLKWHLFRSGLILIYLILLTYFSRHYYFLYPNEQAHEWQAGYEDMIYQVHAWQSQHPTDQVFMTRQRGRPAMYYWFYTQTEPWQVQTANSLVLKDQGEFLEFGTLKFIDDLSVVIGQSGLLVQVSPVTDEWELIELNP